LMSTYRQEFPTYLSEDGATTTSAKDQLMYGEEGEGEGGTMETSLTPDAISRSQSSTELRKRRKAMNFTGSESFGEHRSGRSRSTQFKRRTRRALDMSATKGYKVHISLNDLVSFKFEGCCFESQLTLTSLKFVHFSLFLSLDIVLSSFLLFVLFCSYCFLSYEQNLFKRS